MHNISILFVIDDLPMASGGVLHKRKQNPLHFQLVTIYGRGYLLNSCLKRGADVETASLSFDSRTGVRCKGVFDVTAFHPLPSGQWGITVMGIWSPEKEIAEYLPSLLRMSESYHINEQFTEDYVRRGLENLRRMTRETSEKAARAAREIRESSMAAYQERQRSMEYID